MFHLDRARAGQLITVTQAGRQYRFQVVGKATFDRRHRLPARYFTTTGQPALALVSCLPSSPIRCPTGTDRLGASTHRPAICRPCTP
jgi:hypothetical protein